MKKIVSLLKPPALKRNLNESSIPTRTPKFNSDDICFIYTQIGFLVEGSFAKIIDKPEWKREMFSQSLGSPPIIHYTFHYKLMFCELNIEKNECLLDKETVEYAEEYIYPFQDFFDREIEFLEERRIQLLKMNDLCYTIKNK